MVKLNSVSTNFAVMCEKIVAITKQYASFQSEMKFARSFLTLESLLNEAWMQCNAHQWLFNGNPFCSVPNSTRWTLMVTAMTFSNRLPSIDMYWMAKDNLLKFQYIVYIHVGMWNRFSCIINGILERFAYKHSIASNHLA